MVALGGATVWAVVYVVAVALSSIPTGLLVGLGLRALIARASAEGWDHYGDSVGDNLRQMPVPALCLALLVGVACAAAVQMQGTSKLQTFIPHPDFDECARVLDRARLASQRRECVQLAYANDPAIRVGTQELIDKKNALDRNGVLPKRGWSSHPAAVMWSGRLPALMAYLSAMDREWVRRGYRSNLIVPDLGPIVLPSWLGMPELHSSHRSNLTRKDPVHYGQFGWTEGPDLEYVWPGPCCNLEVRRMSPS